MYKVICSVCKKWIWTTEKTTHFLKFEMRVKDIPRYLFGSLEFERPKNNENHQLACPNCGKILLPKVEGTFEVLDG